MEDVYVHLNTRNWNKIPHALQRENMHTDVAIPTDRNFVQKEAEKKLKYKSLCIEIQCMWNLKCTIIPVITGATRIVMRSLRKNLEAVPGKHSIDSLQKTAILFLRRFIAQIFQRDTKGYKIVPLTNFPQLSFAEASDRVSTVLGICKCSSEKQVQREKHCSSWVNGALLGNSHIAQKVLQCEA
jgi:hypothetical protein